MFLKKLAFLAILAFSALGSAAQAATIEFNQWYTFGFGEKGSTLLPGKPGFTTIDGTIPAPDNPWTFTLAAPAQLIVVDAFKSGDLFRIFDFGQAIGTTSKPVRGTDCAVDLSCVLASPDFSLGIFELAAGEHSITGTVLKSPFDAGAGAFMVSVAPVPLPSAAPLLAVAVAGLAVARRKRRRA